jgi:ubiquinone/menaquinone biosynthesis C-methylase UbiE
MQEKELYNNWHEKRGKAESDDHVLNDPWYQTVMRLLPDLSEKKVLEIGAGRGAFAIWMAQKYPTASIVASDFSEKAIAIAQNKISDSTYNNLHFEVANAEDLQYPDKHFDLVISCETMEHVLDPQAMANEIYRVLKPGGGFILTTENYLNGMLINWIKAWITKRPFNSGSGIQPHENFFLFFKVANYFKRAGMLLTHTESNHYQWLLLPGVNPASLCTKNFHSPFLKSIFKPFGRHYTFVGIRPNRN